jgi:tetratricopeptide (TPR) repeat protein
MRLRDPTDWLEDFTIHLSEEEISSMLSDVEETLVFTGSKPVAAVWLTVAGVLGGFFGGVVVSGAMWRSVWLVLAYLLVMPLVWVGMRRLTFGIFGPAIRWQAVLAFFWAFLLGMGAVIGGQITSWWLGYGLSLGAGLLIGLVFGSVNPSFVKNEDAWLLAGLPLGGVSTTFATYVYRNMIADPSTISAAALTGAIAGLILTAPMTALLAALWDVGHGLRHVAVIYLHNDAFAQKAIDYLDRAIRVSPNDADLHNLRGIAWSRAGDQARADADWQKVLELQPKSPEPYMNRGVDFLRHGAFAEAVESLQTAITIDPKYATAHNNLGVALERRGELDRAIEHYDRAIALAPKYARAYSNRGYARFRAKRHERAVEDCDHAIKLDQDLAVAYVNRAHALAALGHVERAAEDYQTAIDLVPSPEVIEEAEKGLEALTS